MPELALFLSSLQFCDAVLQVAHPSVRQHLLALIYMGFLVPVLGPALTQVSPPRSAGMKFFRVSTGCPIWSRTWVGLS